jgi:hypothetical protein
MHKLMRQRRDDLGGIRQFQRDERLGMPIARQLGRPTLADAAAACRSLRPADGGAHLVRMV